MKNTQAYAARRNGFWSAVSDFFQDNNATKNFFVPVGEWIDPVCGSCGPNPDVLAMIKEPVCKSDLAADSLGLFGKSRLHFKAIFALVQRANRTTWMRNQIKESKRTGSAPMWEMDQK